MRCKKRNTEVGGIDNSEHLKGNAVDFYIPGQCDSAAGRDAVVKKAYALGAKYAYANTPGMGNAVHIIKVNDLIKEAQQRLIELKLDDLDEVFSLRLTATKRLFGILPDGVFRILWYDGDHEIYKYKK